MHRGLVEQGARGWRGGRRLGQWGAADLAGNDDDHDHYLDDGEWGAADLAGGDDDDHDHDLDDGEWEAADPAIGGRGHLRHHHPFFMFNM